MKTTNQSRTDMKGMCSLYDEHDQAPITCGGIYDLCSDIDTLESKLKQWDELLERAKQTIEAMKCFIDGIYTMYPNPDLFLSDLEKMRSGE